MKSESANPQDERAAEPWQATVEAAILILFEKQGKDFLAPGDLLSLFEHTKTMHGFNCVCVSWRRAAVSYMTKMRGKKLLMAQTRDELAEELFFCALAGKNYEATLRSHAQLIHNRACLGDVTFFNRICKERAKPNRRKPQRKNVNVFLLSAWLHGFLWLLSSKDRLVLIEQFGFKGLVTLKGLERARKRLGLQGWADLGPDHYPQAPFKLDDPNNGALSLIVRQ
jgi:hypothetical protein